MKKERFDIGLKACILLALYLVSDNADGLFGYSPFTIGLFVASCYSGQNLMVSSSAFVLSGIIQNPCIEIIIVRVTGALVLFISLYALKKIKKNVTMSVLNVMAFLCRIPEIAFALSSGVGVYTTITATVIGQVFAYFSAIALFALFVRGIKIKFTVDELVSMSFVGIVLSCGLYGFVVFGFRPFYALAGFFALASTYALGPYGVVVGVLIGVGTSLGGDVYFLAHVVCGTLAVLAFRNLSHYFAGAGFFLSVCGVGYFFGGKSFSTLDVIAILIGVVAFCALPKKIMSELSGLLSAIRERYGGRGIVNRNRADISAKLSMLASLFWDLSAIVGTNKMDKENEEDAVSEISRRVVSSFCGDCAKKKECEEILKGKTYALIEPAVRSALSRGRATLLELPTYMTGSCIKVNSLISKVGEEVENYLQQKKEKRYTDYGRSLIGEQLFLTGELLGSISVSMQKNVGFDVQKERVLVDELAHKNVLCSEAVIEKDSNKVVLFVKDAKVRKRAIEKVTSKVLKKPMQAYIDKDGERNGFDMVVLSVKTLKDMAFGQITIAKSGQSESGDSRMIMRAGRDKYVFAIADGMGSGEQANSQSTKAVSMIESFYKAGFNRDTVIGLANKILTFSGSECYSTLDMCVVDLEKSVCDFIKLGACPSYLKRGEMVNVIEGESLPMGVFGEVSPTVISHRVKENDMIILCSDGVTDCIGADELELLIQRINTPNPQEMASLIKKRATQKGALDDVSIVVGKVYAVR